MKRNAQTCRWWIVVQLDLLHSIAPVTGQSHCLLLLLRLTPLLLPLHPTIPIR